MDTEKTVKFLLDEGARLDARLARLLSEQERIDKREREARSALLAGIEAYLRALGARENGQ